MSARSEPLPPAGATPEPQAPDAWPVRLSRLAQRHGFWPLLAGATAAAMLLSVLLGQLVVTLAGRGDRTMAAIVAAAIAGVMAPPACALLLRLAAALAAAQSRLGVLSTQDELTGLFNRRHFLEVVQREWDRAKRYETPSALLLVDADHFRRVNDAHGHRGGDELLRQIAGTTAGSLRQPDVLARFGGEELIVFLPHTDLLGAIDVAERIREQVQRLAVPWQQGTVGTTVSIGVAPMRRELESLDWMIHEADTALQLAKTDGRNCVRALPFERSRRGDAFSMNLR